MYLNRMKKHFFSLLTRAWRSIDIIWVCLREKQIFIIYKIKIQCPHTRFAGQKNNLYNGKG